VSKRSYGQYCGLARALDLIGERWTLLLVRDLAVAPRRFTELLSGMPGIGTSLLSERLKHLEEIGVARRAIAERPSSGVVYELTDRGRDLADAMRPLAMWGAIELDQKSDDADFRPEWLMFTLQSSFRPEAAAGVHDCYELRVDGEVFWVVVDDGSITVTQDKPRKPDFVATADLATLAALGSGQLAPDDAVRSGRAKLKGDAAAGERALRILGST
jgi:DNA-binding HxlR family transcriptional regulator/putative sterol carrier protein